jgi:hypothetical protein
LRVHDLSYTSLTVGQLYSQLAHKNCEGQM